MQENKQKINFGCFFFFKLLINQSLHVNILVQVILYSQLFTVTSVLYTETVLDGHQSRFNCIYIQDYHLLNSGKPRFTLSDHNSGITAEI